MSDLPSRMARGVRTHGTAGVGFVLLTIVLTYPLAFQVASAVSDAGDPLLNAWILAWNSQRFSHGQFVGFFDANMFFPAPNTLAYSEFLIPQSVVATPVYVISGNPVLAYNVVLLLSLATTAFGAYLLGAYLTNRAGGLVAGLIFAFNPFMFSHLSHLQVLGAAGIPMALLYLHKFFATGRTTHLLLFSLFYVVQALANAYYAVYLTLFGGLFIVGHIVRRHRYTDRTFWGQLGLHVAVSLAVLGPFFYRYLILRRDLGFAIRQVVSDVTPKGFLAATDVNWLYGKVTGAYQVPEAILFPGVCAVLLALGGTLGSRAFCVPLRHTGQRWVVAVYRTFGWMLAAFVGVVLWMMYFGEIDTTVWSVRVRATSFQNPVTFIVLLALARSLLRWRCRIAPLWKEGVADARLAYFLVLVLAVLLTVPGPSNLLYGTVPGFDGLRAVSRAHVMTMLAVAILASYGISALTTRLRDRLGLTLAGLLALVATLEYLSIPTPLVHVPVGKDIPGLYRWLASQPEDFAFVEYPIVRRLQLWQVYFSSYHWKRSMTGASAFASPVYVALRRRQENVPSAVTLHEFEGLGVRYLIVHERPASNVVAANLEDRHVDPRQLDDAIGQLGDRVRLVAVFQSYDTTRLGDTILVGGRARVYELIQSHWRPPRLVRDFPVRDEATLLTDRTGWSVTASVQPDRASLAVDGDPSTRWASGRQQPGEYFQIDLGKPVLINGLTMDVFSRWDYPRGYRVEVSSDARDWTAVTEAPTYWPPLTEMLRPRSPRVEIRFQSVTSRFIRVVQTGSDRTYWWSISEISPTTPGRGRASSREGGGPL